MLLSRFHSSIKWQGRLSLAAGYRWQSSSQKLQEANQSDHPMAVKPFSAVPSPSGALPIIGHLRLLKDVKSFSKFITEKFRELGPIFRLNSIGKTACAGSKGGIHPAWGMTSNLSFKVNFLYYRYRSVSSFYC